MKLSLLSDFHDWYDFEFDSHMNSGGASFRRFSTDGMNRIEMLDLLDECGYNVPARGYVKDMKNVFPNYDQPSCSDMVVVYTDINSHRGENKELVSYPYALQEYNDYYCTEYIGLIGNSRVGESVSFRYLQIGDLAYWFKFVSKKSWKSNFDPTIELLCEIEPSFHKKIKVPLFAIDFVLSDWLYAIDFNMSPGLEYMKDIISAKVIVGAIKYGVEKLTK